LKRNEGHGKRLRAVQALGYPATAIVHLIAEHLTEQEALCLEAKLIYFFGSIYDTTAKGCLVNLADHMRPDFLAPSAAPSVPRPHPCPPLQGEIKQQWANWQKNPAGRKYLSPELLQQGYVLLHIPPQTREAFVTVATLLKYHGRLGQGLRLAPTLQGKCHRWLEHTRRLTAILRQHGPPGANTDKFTVSSNGCIINMLER
jgi:hypothetical protein